MGGVQFSCACIAILMKNLILDHAVRMDSGSFVPVHQAEGDFTFFFFTFLFGFLLEGVIRVQTEKGLTAAHIDSKASIQADFPDRSIAF